MNKKLLVLPVSILVLAGCGGTSSNTTGDSSGTSTSDSSGTSTSTPAVEYISQAALDSLKGKIKLSGTYTVTNYTDPDYSYSGDTVIIYEGDAGYYSYDSAIEYEFLTINVEGNAATQSLSEENKVITTLLEDDEGNPVPWEYYANPLENLVASNFVLQEDGSYSATNADDRAALVLAAYGYDMDVAEASVEVTNNVITSISFTTTVYEDYFGDTVVDSGTITVSDHGTAAVPKVEAKPVVPEHTNLSTALAALASAESLKVTTSEDMYNETTGAYSGNPVVWDEYFTPTAYYSSYEQDISEDETPVYVTNGYVVSDENGAYGFSRSEDGSVELTSNYPSITDLTELKSEYYQGFAPALLESKGSGVFEAYEDTIYLVAEYLIMDLMPLDDLSIITSLAITVASDQISKIAYEYDYYDDGDTYTYKAEVTFDTTVTIPVDLTGAFALANTFADINEYGFMGIWTDGTNTLIITDVSITFNGTAVTNIEANGDVFTFDFDEGNYRVEFSDINKTALLVEHLEGSTLTLSKPVQTEMPSDVIEAVRTAFGVELTLPGVPGATITFASGTDGTGATLVILNVTGVSLDYYLLLLQTFGWTAVDRTSDAGCWIILDPEQELWFQAYDEDGYIEIGIWAYPTSA